MIGIAKIGPRRMIPRITLRRDWTNNQFFFDNTEITYDQWQQIHDEAEKCRCHPCKYPYLKLGDKIDKILREGEK
jgi:hypothetical protein